VKNDVENTYQAYQHEKKQLLTLQKDTIKNLGDQAISLLRFLKVFKVQADKIPGEFAEVYNDLDRIIAEFPITKHYDALRNYLTKKPFSQEKIKLNFDCSTLL
jgi:CRISPR-associated protein Cpf1